MRSAIVLLFLLSLSFCWDIDGICNRSAGESCMNSPDCRVCAINLSVEVSYSEAEAVVGIEIASGEPEELPLLVSLKEEGETEPLLLKPLDLKPFSRARFEQRIERKLENRSFMVEVIDRELSTPWARKGVTVLGLEQPLPKPNAFLGLLGVISFFAILYFGVREIKREKSPYVLPPIYGYPPPPPEQPEEEVIIVPKKKKYYYTKR